MRWKNVVGVMSVCLAVGLAAHAWASPEFARQTKAACVTCHVTPAGGPDLTDTGKAFKADPTKVPGAGSMKAAEYVGINKCKMCHMKQYKASLETRHSNALGYLQKADAKAVADMAAKLKVELKGPATQNDACVTCHVTGFHLAGGYPAADSAKTAAVSNVTCEACHGPGSLHIAAAMADKKKFINGHPSAKLCMQCHTATTSPNFKFEEYKARGVHVVKAGS
jgi:hypothetical protein